MDVCDKLVEIVGKEDAMEHLHLLANIGQARKIMKKVLRYKDYIA